MAIKSAQELVGYIASINPPSGSPFQIGVVRSISPLNISFDGEVDDNGNPITNPTSLVSLAGYFPTVGDRVLLAQVGKTWVVIDIIQSAPVWQSLSPYYVTNITDFGSPYDPGQFTKIGGIVYLRGLIKATGAIAQVSDIITGLPAGYGRAAINANGSMYGTSGARSAAVSPIRLTQHGYSIMILESLVNGDSVALSGISWPADQ